MGGGQSLAVGLEHPDVFRWVDGFSAYVGYHDLEAAFPTTRLRTAPELLWISCATSDGGFPATQRFIAWLKAKGILQKSQL